MKTSYTQNPFIAYLLMLWALFILIFFTKNIFADMQIALDEREQNRVQNEEKKNTLSELSSLKEKLMQEWSEALGEIQWFTGDFSDKNILEYLHTYAGQINAGNERIIMRDITINGGQVSDIGFNKAIVNVSAVFSSEQTLFGFVDYLTDIEWEYRFYITNFNYPMNEGPGNLQVTIPLTLYYK